MARPLFLPRAAARRLHASALRILERTGILLDHPEAADLCLRAGARRDESGRVLLPGALVEDCLRRAVRPVPLYDRDGREALLLGPGRTYFGPGSDALYNIDRRTGELRPSVLADVAENVRVADAMGSFDFLMSMALPKDASPGGLYPAVFAEMVRNSAKPIVTTAASDQDVRGVYAVAAAAAGGEDNLRRRPFFVAYLEPVSPLRVERSIADRLLFCADKQVPFLFAAGNNCGGGCPVTPEGGVAQGTAESLAGLVLAMLKNPQARFIFGSSTSSVDMRTSVVCYGPPEWNRTVAMYADLGRFYGLPSWGTAGGTDAHRLDAQAGLEAYEGILLAIQCGSTLVHNVGYMAYGSLYDARMLVLGDAMIRRARHLLRPADLSPEALAEDVIDEVSRQESVFLAHRHTRENYRKALWLPPRWVNRSRIEGARDRPELGELLREEVLQILARHRPVPLEEERERRILKVLAEIPP